MKPGMPGGGIRAHADRVAKISIIPRGVAALGYAQQQPTEDRYLLTRTELLDRLDVLLGGRTAEIIFGDVSTGAQDDLQRATDLVRRMITRYGMSEALGLATFEHPARRSFSRYPQEAQSTVKTARVIDAEIQKLLEASHASPGNVNRQACSIRVWPGSSSCTRWSTARRSTGCWRRPYQR